MTLLSIVAVPQAPSIQLCESRLTAILSEHFSVLSVASVLHAFLRSGETI
jgi:hypothetical protein